MTSAQITRLLGPSSRRQAPVESKSPSVICDPVPDAKVDVVSGVSKILVELAREVARVQGQHAGKEEGSETSDENWQLLEPKSARVVSGRRHHHLRMLVDHLMRRDGRSEESLLERGAVRTLAARQNHQTALGTFLKFVPEAHASSGRRRQNRRCPGRVFQRLLLSGSSASQWFTASPLWV